MQQKNHQQNEYFDAVLCFVLSCDNHLIQQYSLHPTSLIRMPGLYIYMKYNVVKNMIKNEMTSKDFITEIKNKIIVLLINNFYPLNFINRIWYSATNKTNIAAPYK